MEESDAAEESPEDAEDEFDEEEASPDEAEDEGDWDEPEFDDEGIEDELPEEEQSEEAEFEPIIEEKPDRLQKLKEKLKNHEKDKAEKKEQAKSAPKEKPKPKDEKKPEEKKPEPSVIEAPEEADDTTGMNFVQKAQYRAKMRRREQTRLRRENARRIQEGAEVTYQPMTRLDMQLSLIHISEPTRH